VPNITATAMIQGLTSGGLIAVFPGDEFPSNE